MKRTEQISENELLRQLDTAESFEEGGERATQGKRTVARMHVLWGKRRLLVRATLYGLGFAALVAFLIPLQYESTARLMPPDSSSSSNLALIAAASGRVGAGGLGSLAGDVLGLKSTGALFVGILQSRTVRDRLVEKFDLKSLYWASRIEDARDELADRTQIIEDRKSGIVSIRVTDNSPQRARDLARAYVEELNRLVTDVSTSAARRERLFVEERLKVVKGELDQASGEFSQFASKNTAIDIKEQGRAMMEAAATLQAQFIVAQTELEALKQTYADNNVRVRAVQARVAELKKQLEKLGGRESMGPDGNGAVGIQSDRGASADSLYPSIRMLPLLGVTWADLYRRTKIAETVYELLTQQYELARVQEAKEIPSVRILDEPMIPERKSFPPRLLFMTLGAISALALATLWVLMVSQWAEMDSRDPRKALAHEVWSDLRQLRERMRSNGHARHSKHLSEHTALQGDETARK